jgi:hypothetical protein
LFVCLLVCLRPAAQYDCQSDGFPLIKGCCTTFEKEFLYQILLQSTALLYHRRDLADIWVVEGQNRSRVLGTELSLFCGPKIAGFPFLFQYLHYPGSRSQIIFTDICPSSTQKRCPHPCAPKVTPVVVSTMNSALRRLCTQALVCTYCS